MPLKPIPPYTTEEWGAMTVKERDRHRQKQPHEKERRKLYQRRPEIKRKSSEYHKRPDVIAKRIIKRNMPENKLKQSLRHKKYAQRLDAFPNGFGPRFPGTKTITQFCYVTLHQMRHHTFKLGFETPPEYTHEQLIEIAQSTPRFVVDEKRSFELKWTNGFYNSASMQRWDNSIGYTIENTTPIPIMLQCQKAFTIHDLRNIPELVLKSTPRELMEEWKMNLKAKTTGRLIFYHRANKMMQKSRPLEFGFDSRNDAIDFLCAKFVDQGGLCAYSGAPMRLQMESTAFVMSVERINPIHGYHPENIALICTGLNGPIFGMHPWYRKHDNDSEAHRKVVNDLKFNLEYWRKSMCFTPDVLNRIEEIRAQNREMMRQWL